MVKFHPKQSLRYRLLPGKLREVSLSSLLRSCFGADCCKRRNVSHGVSTARPDIVFGRQGRLMTAQSIPTILSKCNLPVLQSLPKIISHQRPEEGRRTRHRNVPGKTWIVWRQESISYMFAPSLPFVKRACRAQDPTRRVQVQQTKSNPP